MLQSRKHLYHFGPFSLSRAERILTRQGQLIEAEPRTIDTLIAFIERRGEVLTKEQLRVAIWGPQTFVEPNTVERQVCVLRKILRAASSEEVFIETIPKRGYRFITSVTETGATTPVGQPAPPFANAGSRASLALQVVSRALPIALVLTIGWLLYWKYLAAILLTQ